MFCRLSDACNIFQIPRHKIDKQNIKQELNAKHKSQVITEKT